MAPSEDVLHTPVCDLLGIEHTVVQAGMGYVARAELAAAVSNAGGLGAIGGAGFPPERLRLEIQRVRELTDRPFGVDLILPAQTTTGEVLEPRPPHARPRVDAEELAQDVNLGEFAVNRDGTPVRPEELMRIVAEEEVPAVVAAVDRPVLVAGGICDGVGLATALATGAQGAWMGRLCRGSGRRRAPPCPSSTASVAQAEARPEPAGDGGDALVGLRHPAREEVPHMHHLRPHLDGDVDPGVL